MYFRRESVYTETLSGNHNPPRRTWMPTYSITIEAIATFLLLVRLVSRLQILGGRAGFDDILVILGWLCGLGLTIGACYSESAKLLSNICG
jgi:hypothetical protein